MKELRLIPLCRLLTLAAWLALCWAVAEGASAQTWPDQPLKFVVAAPAGSSIAPHKIGAPGNLKRRPVYWFTTGDN